MCQTFDSSAPTTAQIAGCLVRLKLGAALLLNVATGIKIVEFKSFYLDIFVLFFLWIHKSTGHLGMKF